MTSFTREIQFIGAYALRGDGKAKRNFGIHGMDLIFSVKGPLGAITATIYTKWFLPQQWESTYALYSKGYPFNPAEEFCAPDFIDIGYHAKEAQYESQTSQDDCKLTDGVCFYDGSSLWGNEAWREGFLHGGSDWLFQKMEDEYRNRFEGGPQVDLTPTPRRHPDEVV